MFSCISNLRRVWRPRPTGPAEQPPAYTQHAEEFVLTPKQPAASAAETFSTNTTAAWALYHLVAKPRHSTDDPGATDGPCLWSQDPDKMETSGGISTYTFDVRSGADKLRDVNVRFTTTGDIIPAERNIANITYTVIGDTSYNSAERTMVSFTGPALYCHNVVEGRRSYGSVSSCHTTHLVPVVPFHREGPSFIPLVRFLQLRISVSLAVPAFDVSLQFDGTMVHGREELRSNAMRKWADCDTFFLWQRSTGGSSTSWAKSRTYPASLNSAVTTISLGNFTESELNYQRIRFLVLHSETKVVHLRLQINKRDDATFDLSGLYASTVAFEQAIGRQGPDDCGLYAIPLNGLCAQTLEHLQLTVTTEGIAEGPFTVYGRILGGALPTDVTLMRASPTPQ